jgi:hypothetical protein
VAKQGDCLAGSTACADLEPFDIDFANFRGAAAKRSRAARRARKNPMTARKRVLPPPPKPARPRRRRGAQPGNKNSLKTGSFTRDIRALKADVWAYIRRSHALVEECERILDKLSRDGAKR